MNCEHLSNSKNLSIARPVGSEAFAYFQSDIGKKIILSGWKGAGITAAIQRARETDSVVELINPFNNILLVDE